MYTIYLVRNTLTGKIYIGKTGQSVALRWNRHWKDSRQQDTYFYRALRKYGKAAFSVTEIDSAETCAEANELEKLHIAISSSHRKLVGYNTTFGGDGCVPTEEIRHKLSLMRRGNQYRKGVFHSEDTKTRMSLAHSGKKCYKYRHDIDDGLLSSLYQQGKTSRELATIFKTGKTTILRRLQESGTKLRPPTPSRESQMI